MATAKPNLNQLLSVLPSNERRSILTVCSTEEVTLGDVLNEPGDQTRNVYFPLSAILSAQVTVDGNDCLEVGLIGSEGFYGGSLSLGVERAPLRATVQYTGLVFRMRASDFRDALEESTVLRSAVGRYQHVFLGQLAQTAYCTCYHVLEARVARWMLMMHDRANSDRFRLTHELLAEMLGVRRSGVSVAAAALQERGLISYNRGVVTVANRRGLETAACECYRHAEQFYEDAFRGSRWRHKNSLPWPSR